MILFVILNIISIFFLNILYTNYFLQLFSKRENAIIYDGLQNIVNDLDRIQFPTTINISLFSISIIVSIFSILLIILTVYRNINVESIENILKTLIKLFFINLTSITSIFYFLRIYNVPRGLLLINLFLFPFVAGMLVYFLKYFDFSNLKNRKKISLGFALITISFSIYFISANLDNNLAIKKEVILSAEEDAVAEITKTLENINLELEGDYVCYKWSGSENYQKCIKGTKVKILDNFGESLNNVVQHENDLYLLNVDGLIYKNNNKEIFMDLSDKILSRITIGRGANGLFGLAFHPEENYFIVSYSDLNNNFILEKYLLNNTKLPILDSGEILLKIPNGSLYHFAGSLIWSEYFNDFLINIGDMDAAQNPIIKSEALYTNSPRGKILLLNSTISNPDIVGEDKTHIVRKDILGYGLRNPWKTIEYKNLLFIPDIGNQTQEELNIVNLDDFKKANYKPFLFGWPYYEGSLINDYRYTEVTFWEDNKIVDAETYIVDKTIQPVVYYNHDSPDTYRAALIGGGIIEDAESKYFEHYFFAEYFAKEIYSYDYKNDLLYQYPLPQDFESYITSVSINQNKKNSLIISAGNGNLVEVTLPDE